MIMMMVTKPEIIYSKANNEQEREREKEREIKKEGEKMASPGACHMRACAI
jgi:hypothetical protein